MKNTGTTIGSALFVWLLALGLSAGVPVRGQAGKPDDIYRQGKRTLQLANQSPQARSLARQRYQFLHQLQSKFGIRLYHIPEFYTDALFPVGRADRVYVLDWGWAISCYQHKNGKVKLVYQVRLDQKEPRTKKDVKTWKLLGYLDKITMVVKGKISRYALSDLTSKQDCVEYSYYDYMDALNVFLISRVVHDDQDNYQYLVEQIYNVDEDPLTNAPLKHDEFYQKYGLPVSSAELALFGIAVPAETGTNVK